MTHHRGHRVYGEKPKHPLRDPWGLCGGSFAPRWRDKSSRRRSLFSSRPSTRVVLGTIFFAACTVGTLHAQTASISIPAWIETNDCALPPKFEATLNGRSEPVTAQLGPGSDQVILVVLDLAGDLSLIDAAKQALIAEISKLPANAWVGLLRTQDGLRALADPSPNRQPLLEAIRSLSNSSEPGLLETAQSALSLADGILRASPVRVSVLYITDGSIYGYREDYTNPIINESDPHDLSRRFPEALVNAKISKLVDDTSSLEAPLFVVHLNYRRDRLNVAYQNGLGIIAEATGGRSDICRSVAEVPEAVSAVFARISSAWRLTLALPARIHYNIQIHLSAPCGDGDLRMSWRTHFRPKEG